MAAVTMVLQTAPERDALALMENGRRRIGRSLALKKYGGRALGDVEVPLAQNIPYPPWQPCAPAGSMPLLLS